MFIFSYQSNRIFMLCYIYCIDVYFRDWVCELRVRSYVNCKLVPVPYWYPTGTVVRTESYYRTSRRNSNLVGGFSSELYLAQYEELDNLTIIIYVDNDVAIYFASFEFHEIQCALSGWRSKRTIFNINLWLRVGSCPQQPSWRGFFPLSNF